MHAYPGAIAIRRCQWIALHDRAGDRVECVTGSVWITQYDDLRDVVIEAGQAFTLDRRGTALVSAVVDACVRVQRRAPLDRKWTRGMQWLRAPRADALHGGTEAHTTGLP